MKGKSKQGKKVDKLKRSEKHVPKDLEELEHNELSGYESKASSLSASSTDENEDEGLGDGNMGRSQKDILGK